MLAVGLPLILLGLTFFMGQRIHTNAMSLNDAIYQTHWPGYPLSVRRYVVLMMLRSQQSYYLSAYGIMQLHLENFVQVILQY